jgi:signal peptidase I
MYAFTLLAIVAIILLVIHIDREYFIVKVDGFSMYPTYNNGDMLIAKRVCTRDDMEFDKVYIYRHDNKYIIKRLISITDIVSHKDFCKEHNYYFLGDNLKDSIDSRLYGAIPFKDIVGKVMFKFKRGR